MRQTFLFIFNFCCILLAFGQTDSAAVVSDTLVTDTPVTVAETSSVEPEEKSTSFIHIGLQADYGKLAATLAGWDKKYELGLSLELFGHLFLLGELGKAQLSPKNAFENGSYTSEGNYYRIGGGYIKDLNPKNKLGIAVLYAASTYQHNGTLLITSPSQTQADVVSTFSEKNLTAHWLEASIISESRIIFSKDRPESIINRLISLGFYVRARFLSAYDHSNPVDTYAIPGYGRVINDPNIAVNLFLRVHIL